MSENNHPIVVCAMCGSRSIKVASWLKNRNKMYHFCSLQCKRDFLEEKVEGINNENRQAEGVLPEVQTFIGRKKGDHITVVRSVD